MNCPATNGTNACRRLDSGNETYRVPHPLPHVDHEGTQWDDSGIRVRPGRSEYERERR